MPNTKKLHIVFATNQPANAVKLVSSIKAQLSSWQLDFAALVFGQNTVSPELCEHCTIIKHCATIMPIHETRNHCQRYLKQSMRVHGGFGLILDDDLHWHMKDFEFARLCAQLQSKHMDMAFIQLAGDPPIPKEYTKAAPLLDVLLAMKNSNNFGLSNNAQTWLNDINLAKHQPRHVFHDFYAYNKHGFYPQAIALNIFDFDEFITHLYLGKTTTRKVPNNQHVSHSTGRHRGGATLILNYAVLNFLNLSININNIHSRRSDMLMAKQAYLAGANLCCVPAALSHQRTKSLDSHRSDKIIGDILGYCLVESYHNNAICKKHFAKHFISRTEKTKRILSDSGLLLTWLKEAITDKALICLSSSQLIDDMIDETYQTYQVLEQYKNALLMQLPQLQLSIEQYDLADDFFNKSDICLTNSVNF